MRISDWSSDVCSSDLHEQMARAIIEDGFPDMPLSVSCEVLPEIKEYERTSTTVVNAYILPAMRDYLTRLKVDLGRMGINASLQVMADRKSTRLNSSH